MFIKPSFRIIDSSLMIVVGPFAGDAYSEADVNWYRDTHGMSFTGSTISPTSRYGNLKKTLDGYRLLSPTEWDEEFKSMNGEEIAAMRNTIKEKRDYEAYLATKNRS